MIDKALRYRMPVTGLIKNKRHTDILQEILLRLLQVRG